MSTTFLGIENQNEFYSQHYLAAIVTGDLARVPLPWRRAEAEGAETQGSDSDRHPPTAFKNEHTAFFRYLDELERERSASERVRLHRERWASLLHTLGYSLAPVAVTVGDMAVPLLLRLQRPDGEPLLYWLPAVSPPTDATDVLSRRLLPEQFEILSRDDRLELTPEAIAAGGTLDVEGIVNAIFAEESPPRFVLVAGDDEIVLFERAKWAEQRLLRFELRDILGRREPDTLLLTTVILHRGCIAPEAGDRPLIDTLDDNSHDHAYEVSEDLKFALRECIELLGNAVVADLRARGRRIYEEDRGETLSRECLTYMYRLLFLFYLEARPDLGYAPMGNDAYRLGYSLERLRDLESRDLLTPEALQGTYIQQCLNRLFTMIHDGAAPSTQQRLGAVRPAFATDDEGDSLHGLFSLPPLKSHLFDPTRTPLLSGARLPNQVLQQILRLMSLSGEAEGARKTKRRGRISYATLGINQLGAVYEALLSYRGFFAHEDLYEVKKAGENPGPLDPAFFVTEADLPRYEAAEIVRTPDGRPKKYSKSTFIYRLAGRDRQKSASYYTPQVLTRCLVKYALKERLEDEHSNVRLSADEILQLKICEPAMGSAAFLNEAIDQLADAYLRKRQEELGPSKRIRHDDYAWEKQRVKMYLADNNVFGVDLNPTAIELAQVSLWLNSIYESKSGQSFVPWFGMQLACGNSLIGARKQVFVASELASGRGNREAPWLDAVPGRAPLGTPRPANSAYHFLLGDRGMSVYGEGTEGKPIRERHGESLDAIKKWRTAFCAPLEESERRTLVALSDAIDRLWEEHIDVLRDVRARTTDPLEVYGYRPPNADRPATTTADKDRIWNGEVGGINVRASGPYSRLKLAMDYWCALWFWPIDRADDLPDRAEYLADLSLLLDSNIVGQLAASAGPVQRDLFAPTMPAEKAERLQKKLGFVDVERLVQNSPRLKLVRELAKRYRYLHWELEFADVFAERGGFDLILGNPPWIRIEWKEADILGERDPILLVRDNIDANEVSRRREEAFSRYGNEADWLAGHVEAAGVQSFLSSTQNYPALEGGKVNLYKCFLPAAWMVGAPAVVSGFLHPEGIYDEPASGRLRRELYSRLRRHYQFANAQFLFAEVHDRTRFSVNIYGPSQETSFEQIANLFHPSTIPLCHDDAGAGPVPGIKTPEGQWETSGHRERVIEVSRQELRLFARLYDEPGTPTDEARLPAIHAMPLIRTLQRFAEAEALGTLADNYLPTFHFNETYALRDGTLRRETHFAQRASAWVISGPQFHNGNPFNKTPRRIGRNNSDYDPIDLSAIPDDYLPRTNYAQACSESDYRNRTPKVPWSKQHVPVTEFYRVVVPNMINPANERTIKAAVIPIGAAHIHAVNSYTFADEVVTLLVAGIWSTVVADFLIKTTGAEHFHPNIARQMPLAGRLRGEIVTRALRLNCLTTHYGPLWQRQWKPEYTQDQWARSEALLPTDSYSLLTPEWKRNCALRSDYQRRQALVETDALVAMALGMTGDELQTIYRVQFPVLRQNERETFYDQNGRIVFTCSRGLVGVGLPRKRERGTDTPGWEDVKHMQSGTVEQWIDDDTMPGGPVRRKIVYQAPWVRCDRERDYEEVWAEFERRYGKVSPKKSQVLG